MPRKLRPLKATLWLPPVLNQREDSLKMHANLVAGAETIVDAVGATLGAMLATADVEGTILSSPLRQTARQQKLVSHPLHRQPPPLLNQLPGRSKMIGQMSAKLIAMTEMTANAADAVAQTGTTIKVVAPDHKDKAQEMRAQVNLRCRLSFSADRLI